MSSSHPTTTLCLRKRSFYLLRKHKFLPASFKSHVMSRSSFFLCPSFFPSDFLNIFHQNLEDLIFLFMFVGGRLGKLIFFLMIPTDWQLNDFLCLIHYTSYRLHVYNWFLSHMINCWLINQKFVINFNNLFFGNKLNEI